MLKNKKCLVTGSNGFIGRHLVDRLHKEEAIVYSLNRNPSKVKAYQQYIVDIRDPLAVHKVIQEIKPEYIFHFAGSTLRESPEQTHLIDINAFGTKNVLDALSSIKYNLFIYPSTSSVYSNNYSVFSEDTQREPKTAYGTSKLLAEEYCLEHIASGKPIVIVRPFSIYGPGQEDGTMFIPTLMRVFKEGGTFKLQDGKQTRDYLYIDDFIQLLMDITASNIRGEILNCGTGKEITLGEIVSLLSVLCKDKKGKIVSIQFREGTDYLHQKADLRKAEALLGWKAIVSLEEGLQKTIELWRNNSF
ncbi:MAG: NAD(P)-dependent oxidoreductase [bacterium]|nr:NAD(P)-dependent oxidoreductase [bacterium]